MGGGSAGGGSGGWAGRPISRRSASPPAHGGYVCQGCGMAQRIMPAAQTRDGVYAGRFRYGARLSRDGAYAAPRSRACPFKVCRVTAVCEPTDDTLLRAGRFDHSRSACVTSRGRILGRHGPCRILWMKPAGSFALVRNDWGRIPGVVEVPWKLRLVGSCRDKDSVRGSALRLKRTNDPCQNRIGSGRLAIVGRSYC
jgi:hypothetical protein